MRKVGIAGLGAAGAEIARQLLAGAVPGAVLSCVASSTLDSARARLVALAADLPGVDLPLIVVPGELPAHADIIIEALPPAAFRQVAHAAIAAGRVFIPLSVGALAVDNADLIVLAEQAGARIIIPSGAVGGLDLLQAALEGGLEQVRLITRKPAETLASAPFFQRQGMDARALTQAVCIFAGSARAAVQAFPTSTNVAATLSLAGIGLDRTRVEVWADPAAQRNCHRIEMVAAGVTASIEIEAVPSAANPRTSRLAADSVLVALRRLTRDCGLQFA